MGGSPRPDWLETSSRSDTRATSTGLLRVRETRHGGVGAEHSGRHGCLRGRRQNRILPRLLDLSEKAHRLQPWDESHLCLNGLTTYDGCGPTRRAGHARTQACGGSTSTRPDNRTRKPSRRSRNYTPWNRGWKPTTSVAGGCHEISNSLPSRSLKMAYLPPSVVVS